MGSGAVHEFDYEVVEGAAKVIWGHLVDDRPYTLKAMSAG